MDLKLPRVYKIVEQDQDNCEPSSVELGSLKAEKPEVEWSSGLGDCFEDAATCCYGFWCCPCLACTVSGRLGENRCLPLCDMFSAMLSIFGGPACVTRACVPPAALSVRVAMRNQYGIKGTLCEDIVISSFCTACSWCQMHREIKSRQQVPVVINIQPR